MTPREELLSTGRLGREGVALLYCTVQRVAKRHRFPPPPGSMVWDESAVFEVAHDYVKDERRARRIVDIAKGTEDDRSFERLLDAAVHNFLRESGRKTDFGKLVLRTKEILHDEAAFAEVPGKAGRWTLADGEQAPSTASTGRLTAAIAGTKITVPNWSSGKRDAPLADRPSFVLLLTRVLTAAVGSLTAGDLASVLASRLDYRRTATTTAADIEELVPEQVLVEGDSGIRAVAELHAAEVFGTLSDWERTILADPDATVRELAQQLDMGKTRAAEVRQMLFDRLRDEFEGDDHVGEVAAYLCAMCGAWLRRRTAARGATSHD